MKSKSIRPNFLSKTFPCAISLSLLAALPTAHAADSEWSSTATTTAWTTPGNWVSGVPGTTELATFNSATYSNAPTAGNNQFVGGLRFGASNTGSLTILTATNNNRLNVGSSGLQMTSGSGAVILGTVSTGQGINITADQAWTNNSASLLSVTRVAVDDVAAVGTYTLTINGSGTGGVTVSNNVADVSNAADANRKLAAVINTTGGATNFSNNSTYSGGTTLTAGLLQIGGVSIGAVGAITSSSLGTGTLTLNGGTLSSGSTNARTILNATTVGGNVTLGDATNTGRLTFSAGMDLGGATRTLTTPTGSGAILGGVVSNGSIIKEGAGTLALNGINSSVAVTSNSGTLAGTGSVGATSITAGNLAIGAFNGGAGGTGTMNFSSLSLSSTSSFIYQMTGGVAPIAGSADLGDISGTISINTSSILDLVELGTYTVGNKFTLFAYDGALTGNFSGLANNASFLDDLSNTWQIKYDDGTAGVNGGIGTSYVTITAVPEPGAALLGGLGMLALLRRRRCA